MIDLLDTMDVKVFSFINGSLSNPVFDFFMPTLTDIHKQPVVIIVIAVILAWSLIRGGYKARAAAAVLIATIIVSDQLSSTFIKFIFERQRPCHALQDVHLLVGCGSGFSFPSSHAVNNFAGALVLSFFFPGGRKYFFSYAALIAFSRVYVGVHYPSDIVSGSIIGLMCAAAVISLFIFTERIWLRYFDKKKLKNIETAR